MFLCVFFCNGGRETYIILVVYEIGVICTRNQIDNVIREYLLKAGDIMSRKMLRRLWKILFLVLFVR
jgi:hypothetical protein